MSELNLDDELVQDYLAECREHLATIETDLLAIEQGGAAIDEQLVNRVFRAAHSIKGGAGFFDLAKIRELAHKTENALDLIRSRQMIPTPEVVSILLLAFDKLRELIGNHRESNQADIGEFVSALTALAAGSLPENEKASLTERVAVEVPEDNKHIQVSAFDLNQARKGGKCVYLIEYDLIHDIERRDKTPWDVFKCLIKCGTILETVFDLDSAGTLDDEPSNKLMLEVLYATVLEPDLLEGVVDVPPQRVRLIEKNGVIRPLAEPVPVPAAEPGLPRRFPPARPPSGST
jgi:two-component system chemotaxis sensor kinase CheA